jgi:hypothetical protein
MEVTMTATVHALSRLSNTTNRETAMLTILAIFSGAGLFVSLLLAGYGVDLSVGFF